MREIEDSGGMPIHNGADPSHEIRPWGSWRVLAQGLDYKIKLVEVSPGHRLSLQYHHYRSEFWVVVGGKARVVVANQTYELGMLQSVLIPERTIHRIENPGATTLKIMEVQRGERLLEEDIVRLEDDYHRPQYRGSME